MLTLVGGTCSDQPTVTVTVSGNVVASVSSLHAGKCTVPPPPTASLTTVPAVGTTGGGGTGATFKIQMAGPAIVHVTDGFFIHIDDSNIGNTHAWDGITFDTSAQFVSSVYVRNTLIANVANDGVHIYGSSNSFKASDVFIEQTNYINNNGHAGVAVYGFSTGIFVQDNAMTANGWNVWWDSPNQNLGSNKIRHNDLDSGSSFLYNFTTSHLQDNWGVGTLVCTLCTGLQATGNFWTVGKLYLNGALGINLTGSYFDGPASPVSISSFGGTISNNINLQATGAAGSGYFATLSGSPTNVSIDLTSDGGYTDISTGTPGSGYRTGSNSYAVVYPTNVTYSGSLNVLGSINLTGVPFAVLISGYHAIYDGSGNLSIQLGQSGDPTNYYKQTTHEFSSLTGTAYAFISSGGMSLSSGVYSIGAGTGVSCSGSPTGSFASVGGIVTHCWLLFVVGFRRRDADNDNDERSMERAA